MNCNFDMIHIFRHVMDEQADASIEMERKHFYQESMKYVLLLQAVQERKKFEFVEIVSNLVTFSRIFFLFMACGCKYPWRC